MRGTNVIFIERTTASEIMLLSVDQAASGTSDISYLVGPWFMSRSCDRLSLLISYICGLRHFLQAFSGIVYLTLRQDHFLSSPILESSFISDAEVRYLNSVRHDDSIIKQTTNPLSLAETNVNSVPPAVQRRLHVSHKHCVGRSRHWSRIM